jgi:hypothetical protein
MVRRMLRLVMSDPTSNAVDTNIASRRLYFTVRIVAVFLLSRLLLVGVGAATLLWNGGHFGSVDDLVSLFVRFDAHWYLDIVDHGYSAAESPTQLGATDYAFFPLFPLVVTTVKAVLELSGAAAGVLISNLAFLAALFAVFRYALCLGLSARAAMLTIVLLAVAPQSFVFSAVYSESLFMLLLAAAMLALRAKRWWLSGTAAALLSAVRPNGFTFLVPAIAHLFRGDHWGGVLTVWRRPERYIPLVMAPLGLFAFWWFSYLATGDAFATMTTNREGWYKTIDWPWTNMMLALIHPGYNSRYFMVSSLVFFGLSLLLLKFRYFEEFLFCLANFVLFWSSAAVAISLVRFSITLWPIYLGMARALETRPAIAATVTAGFAGWNAYLMAQWAMEAGNIAL